MSMIEVDQSRSTANEPVSNRWYRRRFRKVRQLVGRQMNQWKVFVGRRWVQRFIVLIALVLLAAAISTTFELGVIGFFVVISAFGALTVIADFLVRHW